jgi:hypothetical protein
MGADLRLARLSWSAKADDPTVAGRRERHRCDLERTFTGYWMPAFAGMTPEKWPNLAPTGLDPGWDQKITRKT